MTNAQKKTTTVITLAVILLYVGLLVGWQLHVPKKPFAEQVPGADNRPAELARTANQVRIGEFFMKYEDTPDSPLTGKWNRFRGAQRDNIITTSETINTSEDAYPILWQVETGEGHAGSAIYNGRVYLLDYNEELSSDALRCFDLERGKELWRRWYRVPIKRNHGFSRTIPVVGDDYVITIGPEGHVMCCDPLTGDMKWSLDMQEQFKTEVPFWYTGQCPLVDGGALVLAPAGEEVLMTGIDCLTGQVMWTTPNSPQFKMSHSSVMPMTFSGKKTFVYIGVGGVCGVSAEGSDVGTLLWSATKWQPSVVAPSPMQLSANQVLLVAGYGNGGALLQVDRTGNGWSATITDQYKPNEGLASEQQTPILFNNMVITILPKDGGGSRGKLVCYTPTDLHNPVWSSAADERFGSGPYLLINNLLFVLKDDGELYVFEAQSKGMKLLKKQRVMEEGIDAWGPLAYADGMMVMRDAHHVLCIRIAK